MAWYDKWAVMVIAAAIGVAGYNGIPWYKIGVAEWAYWVGAVGSIGAIIGAFVLASKQSRDSAALQAATAAQKKKERDQSVRLVIDHCFAAICGLPGRLQRREDYEIHLKIVPRTVFTNLQKLLSAAPLYEVADEKIVVAAMLMMDAMDSTMVLINEIDNMSPAQRIAFWVSLSTRLEEQKNRARGIRANLYAT